MIALLRSFHSCIMSAILLTGFLMEMDGVNAGLRPEIVRCEPLTIPMCRSSVPYNYTMMPNQFHHETQEEAGLEVHQFWPLAEMKCSPDLVLFLCSMYAPLCMETYPKPIPVCRSVCLRTKAACGPIMTQYGFAWPEKMECDQFPNYGDEENLCMDWKNGALPEDQPEKRPLPPTQGGLPHTPSSGITSPAPSDKCTCLCPPGRFDKSAKSASFGGIRGCCGTCRSPFLAAEEWNFLGWWLGVWAITCAVLTIFALSTFMLDRRRFLYPERPIVMMAFCYLMVAMGFILRLYFGHEAVACSGQTIRQGDLSNWTCTMVFILLYFFGMAGCLWWVISSVTWYLSICRKWGAEAVSAYWKCFHLAAWGIPCILTVIILALGFVDGDPVAGVCYVGHHNIQTLLGFVVAPLCVYLVIGGGFLLWGLLSFKSIRRSYQAKDKQESQRFNQQVGRIGTFAVCTMLPLATLLGCNIYEMLHREEWEKTLICDCKKNGVLPHIPVFIIKYLAMLVVGITSAIWFINRKTFRMWANILCPKKCAQPTSTKSSEINLGKSSDIISHHYYKPSYSSVVRSLPIAQV